MLKSYADNKDLYAQIASLSFHKSYEDCLEFYPEGTKIVVNGKEVVCGYKTHTNVEGKKRRSAAKSILLGKLKGFIDFAENIMPLYTVMYIENNVNCNYKQVS